MIGRVWYHPWVHMFIEEDLGIYLICISGGGG